MIVESIDDLVERAISGSKYHCECCVGRTKFIENYLASMTYMRSFEYTLYFSTVIANERNDLVFEERFR